MDNLPLSLKSGLRVHIVESDIMSPTFSPDDCLIVDCNDKDIRQGGIFALFDSQVITIRRITPVPQSSPPKFDVSGDNKLYSTYRLPVDSIDVAGRITYRIEKITTGECRIIGAA